MSEMFGRRGRLNWGLWRCRLMVCDPEAAVESMFQSFLFFGRCVVV